MVVPYIKALSESFKNVWNKVGVQVHFKGNNTIHNILVAPSNKDTITQKSGVVYRFKCTQTDCKEKYIGESGRTFEERLKEHCWAPSPIYELSNTSGNCINVDSFTTVGREMHGITRTIRKAMFIRVNDPSFNHNLGKFQLPNIWDGVLQDTPALHLR